MDQLNLVAPSLAFAFGIVLGVAFVRLRMHRTGRERCACGHLNVLNATICDKVWTFPCESCGRILDVVFPEYVGLDGETKKCDNQPPFEWKIPEEI